MSIAAAALLFLTAQAPTNELAPVVDHHQHLFSPAAGALASGISTLDARQLVALLDAAGIRRAVVLSVAYQFANPNRPAVQDEYAKVRAENDWTSEQVGQFPDRLVAFCGLNPLKDYALTELARGMSRRLLKFSGGSVAVIQRVEGTLALHRCSECRPSHL